MDIGGELLKGGANWFTEWYRSGGGDGVDVTGGDFGGVDDFLADAIAEGY